jgi:RNA polymerase sigma factor (sigma-70 family)
MTRSCRGLVRACRRGDPTAWDEVLDRYGRLIWSVALRLGAGPEEAEEVFQRTWVAVVEGIHQLRDPDRLATWIANTARHQTYQLFATQRRQRRLLSLDDPPEGVEEPRSLPEHDERLDRASLVEALHAALDRLGGRCRELLALLFLTDPPPDYREVSARTGLAVGSIGPLRARCLARLRGILARMYHQPPTDDC